MNRRRLAKKLIESDRASDRDKLLRTNASIADEKLAILLKDHCYQTWTSRPKEAQNAAKASRSLLKFNPAPLVRAFDFWIRGIADLTRGRLESTIKNLDLAGREFLNAEKEHEAANTQVAKIYALAMLGKYDQAIDCGENSLKIFKDLGDELAAGKVEKNLGNLAARRGDELRAVDHYLSARERFLKLRDREELTMAENSLANSYAELNEFLTAEKFYSDALKRARQDNMSVTEAEIEASLGNLALFRGKLDQALSYLESSRRKYDKLEMPHQTAIAELEIADIYLELNLVNEALEIYRSVVPELCKLKMRAEEARARTNFGKSLIAIEDSKNARRQLRRSVRLYRAENNIAGAASATFAQASLELSSGKFEKALRAIRSIDKENDNLTDERLKLRLDLLEAQVLSALRRFEEARNLLREVIAAAEKHEQHSVLLRAFTLTGMLDLEANDLTAASQKFKKAISIVEKMRAPLPAEEFRMAFLSDKLAPFENLARVLIAQNKYEDAFQTVETARSRSLFENLDELHADKEFSADESALNDELTKLREELNWFYSRYDRASGDDAGKLLAEAAKRETAVAALSRRIESTHVRRGRGGQTAGFSLKKLKQQLGNDKTLVEFCIFDGKICAFLVSSTGVKFVEDLSPESAVGPILEDLRFQFGALRFGTAAVAKFLPELKKRADKYLELLHQKLIAPLGKLNGSNKLIIVPAGVLHYVPFHALRSDGRYLIEDLEINYAPSAGVWQKLDSKSSAKTSNALLLGFADDDIPLVEAEVRSLEDQFAKSKVLFGETATFENFQRWSPHFDIIHVACHGQFRADNPLFSSLHLADGYITVRDVCAADIRADLVTLSACETGLSSVFSGEEILGLARGFISAGASSLVLSLWAVNDEMTAALMKEFYTCLQRGASVPASLRHAQKNFIDKEVHPYFWAPFSAVGR
ncbi:MAG: CHAT domain-containing protein [Pyrinomonadaceae bacterium]|nr:CHAT domain-containing protein [Pyrinomonadaceae bacterium]